MDHQSMIEAMDLWAEHIFYVPSPKVTYVKRDPDSPNNTDFFIITLEETQEPDE